MATYPWRETNSLSTSCRDERQLFEVVVGFVVADKYSDSLYSWEILVVAYLVFVLPGSVVYYYYYYPCMGIHGHLLIRIELHGLLWILHHKIELNSSL